MMTHPPRSPACPTAARTGLICDASYPTFLLTHWAGIASADRGSPLEYVVRKQTLDTASLFGLNDRGCARSPSARRPMSTSSTWTP